MAKNRDQQCKADGCTNYPGAEFAHTGFCGKHQSHVRVAAPKVSLKNVLANQPVGVVDWNERFMDEDGNPDPWGNVNEALGVDYWTLLESDTMGLDHMWSKHSKNGELIHAIQKATPRVGNIIASVQSLLGEYESILGDIVPDSHLNPEEGYDDDFWETHEYEMAVSVMAWELSQFNIPEARELAVYLETVLEAMDPDESPTWFELAVENGQMWHGSIKEFA